MRILPWWRVVLRGAAFIALFGSAAANAQSVRLVPVLQGLSSPVLVTNARDGSSRLFIVEQGGRIYALAPGTSGPLVFLDIASKIVAGGEQGLLGLTFHPQFAGNRRFFVDYTRAGDGATVVAEYTASADPVATAATERILLTIPQPFANHNGGMIEFGPDGYLYIGMGDGGSGNDPGNRAQNVNELLGKILRIGVDPVNGQQYTSAPDNPYFGAVFGRDEIYAIGMRNPFRFSFDRGTGQLYVGDVGQGSTEEVDIVTRGGNYGWRVYEGTSCTGIDPSLCTGTGYTLPIVQYGHTHGRCSVTGGYVYRGARATLPAGTYIFGDYCSGEIFQLANGSAPLLLDTTLNISSFGEDEAGELYVVDLGGTVYRIESVVPATTTLDGSFETPSLDGGYRYDTPGAAWTFTGGSGITGNANDFTRGNPPAPQGVQVGFLQGPSSRAAQTIDVAAGQYIISLRAAQRGNFQQGTQVVRVQVDGVTVGQFQPPGTAYASYTTPAFTIATNGMHTIELLGAGGGGSDFTAFVDDVRLTAVFNPGFANGGFESPALGGAYQYAPADAAWTFSGYAGVTGNNNAFTAGNPPAPEGVQALFLQLGGSAATQAVPLGAGQYVVTFSAAQRANWQFGAQILLVQVDGVTVGQFQPAGAMYASYSTPIFTITVDGLHTITLAGAGGGGSDFTAFVDNVRVTAVSGLADGGFETPALAGAYQYTPTSATWTFAEGAGITGNNNGFTAGNPPAPEGDQVLFLQGANSRAAQTVNVSAGQYTISLQTAQRGNWQFGTQLVVVQVDGVTVGLFQPTGTAYLPYTTSAFTIASAGPHTIALIGAGSGSDFTAFVDDVRINVQP